MVENLFNINVQIFRSQAMQKNTLFIMLMNSLGRRGLYVRCHTIIFLHKKLVSSTIIIIFLHYSPTKKGHVFRPNYSEIVCPQNSPQGSIRECMSTLRNKKFNFQNSLITPKQKQTDLKLLVRSYSRHWKIKNNHILGKCTQEENIVSVSMKCLSYINTKK